MVEPKAIDNPFYRLAPGWAHYPLIAFATAATVIASQSIISGAFSLTRQAVQLGFLPRLRVIHTDATKIGQVYLPFVNVALAVATIAAVIGFGSSDALAGAYGVAVSLLMVITTLLAGFIARQWGFPLWVVLLVNGFFVSVDLAFFAANSLKIVDGGWFPLLIATGIAVTMLTWRRGVQLVEVAREKLRQPHEAFVARLASEPPIRLPGIAAFLTPSVIGVPLALSRLRDMTGAIPEAILLVSVVPVDVPSVAQEDRAKITQVAERVRRVTLSYGFIDIVNVPRCLAAAVARGQLLGTDLDKIIYYIGRENIIASGQMAGMALWRERLFAFMQRNAERTAAYFCIPAERVIEVGTELEI
jgi:KUP system potassium uptake protein